MNQTPYLDIKPLDGPMTFRMMIPVCDVHHEVYGDPNVGCERYADGPCESLWCLLNTGEWAWTPKYRWIVARMRELGWDFGKGLPADAYYTQAMIDWEEHLAVLAVGL